MFNKKTLSLAIAAAATGLAVQNANAVINLDDDTGSVAYAQETISSTTTGTYPVVDAGTDLDVAAELGIGVSMSDQIHVRFNLTNGTFATDLAAGDFDIAGDTGSLAQGGGGQDFAIFSVTVAADRAQTDPVTLALSGLTIGGTVGIDMAVYEDLTRAVNETDPLSTTGTAGAVSLASALAVEYTPAGLTAEVTTDFTEFTVGTSGVLGVVDYNLVTGLLNATDGTAVTDFVPIVNLAMSSVTYSGDFSFGSWGLDTGACDTTLLSVATDGTSATADADDVDGNDLCVSVDGEEIIPEASYSATTTFDDVLASPAFPLGTSNGSVGVIDRNGTSVEIPYLTTFTDYNQRVIIVNRNSSDAPYNFLFITEDGVTATAGDAATGVIPAGQTLVLRVSDVVSFSGGTRGSAVLNIVAPSAQIDAATTQVNLADGGTDTVVLQ